MAGIFTPNYGAASAHIKALEEERRDFLAASKAQASRIASLEDELKTLTESSDVPSADQRAPLARGRAAAGGAEREGRDDQPAAISVQAALGRAAAGRDQGGRIARAGAGGQRPARVARLAAAGGGDNEERIKFMASGRLRARRVAARARAPPGSSSAFRSAFARNERARAAPRRRPSWRPNRRAEQIAARPPRAAPRPRRERDTRGRAPCDSGRRRRAPLSVRRRPLTRGPAPRRAARCGGCAPISAARAFSSSPSRARGSPARARAASSL